MRRPDPDGPDGPSPTDDPAAAGADPWGELASGADASGFDPKDVPPRPVVEVTFEVGADGRTYARVDGLTVRTRPGETPRQAAMRTVRHLVDRIASVDSSGRRSPAVFTRIHGPNRTSRLVVAHRDGRLFLPPQPGSTTTRPAALVAATPALRVAGPGIALAADSSPDSGHTVRTPSTTTAGAATALTARSEFSNARWPGVGRVGAAWQAPVKGVAAPPPAYPLPTARRPADETTVGRAAPGDTPDPGATGDEDEAWSRTFLDRGAASETGAHPFRPADADTRSHPGPARSGAEHPDVATRLPGPGAEAAEPADRAVEREVDDVEHPVVAAVDEPASPEPSPAAPAVAPDLIGLVARRAPRRTGLRERGRRSSPTAARGRGRAPAPPHAPAPAAAKDPAAPGASALETAPGRSSRPVRPRGTRPTTAPPPPRSAAGPTPRRRLVLSRPVIAILAAAAVVLASAGWLITSLLRPPNAPGPAPSASSASSTRLPVPPPPGYTSDVRWSTPALAREAGAVVAVGQNRADLAYVAADRRVHVVDAMTGTDRWSARLPDGALTGPPTPTRIDGRDVLATHVGTTLAWWDVADGRHGATLALPAQARVTFLGTSPMVGLDARTVGVIRSGRLQRVAVPGGAAPLAAQEGVVTAAAPVGWWHLRPGVAPALPTPWEADDPAPNAPAPRPEVVGYLAGSVLTLSAPDAQGRRYVAVRADLDSSMPVSFRGLHADAGATPAPWRPSPSGTWGVLGRTLVDVDAGRVTDLGAWTTTWVTDDRAYGRIGDQRVQAGPRTPRGTLPDGAALAEAQVPAGAAVRVRDGDAEIVHVVPPEQ